MRPPDDPSLTRSLEMPSRLEALFRTNLLDSPAEPSFDRLTRLAAQFIKAPVALVSLVDDHRQFFMSSLGLPEPWNELRETPLTHSFCKHVVHRRQPLIVDNALENALVKDNLAVSELGVAAYIGMPILDPAGEVLGSFCAIDGQPRHWSEAEQSVMADLGALVNAEIALRLEVLGHREAQKRAQLFRSLVENGGDFIAMANLDTTVTYVNPAGRRLVGLSEDIDVTQLTIKSFLSEHTASTLARQSIPAALDQGQWTGVGELRHFSEKHSISVDINFFLVRDPDSREPVCFATILRDATARRRAEREQSELVALVQNSQDLITLATPEGEIRFMNVAGRRMLGLDEEGPVTQPLASFLDEESQEIYHQTAIPEVRDSSSWTGELCLRSINNAEPIWTKSSIFSVYEPGTAHIIGIATVQRNITTDKQSDALLRSGKARLRAILEASLDSVITMNHEGLIVEFSPAAERMFGFSYDEAIDRPLADLIVPPELRDAHRQGLAHYLKTGEGPVLGKRIEIDAFRADNTRFPVEIAISRVAVEGPPIFTAFVRDITERKQAQRKLLESESRFRSSFDNAPIGMALTSIDGRWFRVNRALCEILGYTWSDLLANDQRETIFLGDQSDNELRQRCIEGDCAGFQTERSCRHRKGHHVWVLQSVSLVRDGQGNAIYFIEQIQDVTERRRFESELRKAKEAAEAANRSKSEFLANMSHEVRTPVAAILGNADILLDPNLTPANHDTSLQSIRRNGTHLLQIINDILDLSKIEAGKLEFEIVESSPWQIVLETVSALHVRADEAGINLKAESIGPIPTSLLLEPTRCRQVVVNLVSNAVKFTPRSKSVYVRMKYLPMGASWRPELVIEVEDEGIGISPDQLTRLFQPFQQGDNSTTRKYGGTGLGLFITHRLVEAMGGQISVKSELGVGSTFTVTLPTQPSTQRPGWISPSGPVTHEAATASPHSRRLTGRILIAEDSPDNRRILLYYLSRVGLSADVAENGRIAVEKALEQSYDLILMDMQMPELDGYGAASSLRRAGYDRPIVALTAHALSHDRDKCLRSGCDDYLSKPVNSQALLDCIARHLPAVPHSESHIDQEFQNLVRLYLQSLRGHLGQIEQAFAEGDRSRLRTLVHQTRGVAGMYGFTELGESAGLIESALMEQQDNDLIAELIDEFATSAWAILANHPLA